MGKALLVAGGGGLHSRASHLLVPVRRDLVLRPADPRAEDSDSDPGEDLLAVAEIDRPCE
jgi:hypothetical protein